MKTTVDLPDDLYRRAKVEAALRGRKFKDLVEQGLRLVLETPRTGSPRLSLDGPAPRLFGVPKPEADEVEATHMRAMGKLDADTETAPHD